MAPHHHSVTPVWSWMAPLTATALLVLSFSGVLAPTSGILLALSAIMLGATVFSAVHHAEVVAARVGEPYGSIILAVAVTVIEVALIVSILLSQVPGSEAVARDTVYSAVMIVLNGFVGLCLVLGGQRHYEQSFQLQGASSALAVLGTLAVLTMVLPNFTTAIPGPYYSPFQLVFVGFVSLILYLTFVFVQTVRHRDYFIDANQEEEAADHALDNRPSDKITIQSTLLLLLSLTTVILLAKILSYPLDRAIHSAGLPKAFVGVVIAAVVLLPEGIAAVRAALLNRLQNSINLALGSAIASIGLTIPVVAVVSLIMDRKLTLGLGSEFSVLLILTLFVSALTLGTGRTTVLQGMVHLVIFAVFILLSALP